LRTGETHEPPPLLINNKMATGETTEPPVPIPITQPGETYVPPEQPHLSNDEVPMQHIPVTQSQMVESIVPLSLLPPKWQ